MASIWISTFYFRLKYESFCKVPTLGKLPYKLGLLCFGECSHVLSGTKMSAFTRLPEITTSAHILFGSHLVCPKPSSLRAAGSGYGQCGIGMGVFQTQGPQYRPPIVGLLFCVLQQKGPPMHRNSCILLIRISSTPHLPLINPKPL